MAKKSKGKFAYNVGRSVAFSIKENMKERTPALASLVSDNNQEFMKNIYDTLSDLRRGQQGFSKLLDDNPTLKGDIEAIKTGIGNLGKGWDNFKKTGTLGIDEKEKEKALNEDLGFDDDDLGLDLDDLDDSESDLDKELADLGDLKSDSEAGPLEKDTEAIGSAQLKATNDVTRATIGTGKAVANSVEKVSTSVNNQTTVLAGGIAKSNQINAKLFQGSIEAIGALSTNMMSGINTLNKNAASLVSFNNDIAGKYMEGASKWFDSSLTELQAIHAILDRVYPEENEKKEEESLFEKMGLNTGYGGASLDLSGYLENIKENISNTEIGMFADFLSPDNLKLLLDDPLNLVLNEITDTFFSKASTAILQKVDESFSNFIPSLLGKITKYGEDHDDSLLSTIAKIFGINMPHAKKGLGDYKKDAVPFDGLTRRAITVVIPEYLRQIVTLLGGQDMTYDYRKGRFTSMDDLQKEQESQEESNAKSAVGYENLYKINDFAKKIKPNHDSEEYSDKSDEEKKDLDKFYDNIGNVMKKVILEKVKEGNAYTSLADINRDDDAIKKVLVGKYDNDRIDKVIESLQAFNQYMQGTAGRENDSNNYRKADTGFMNALHSAGQKFRYNSVKQNDAMYGDENAAYQLTNALLRSNSSNSRKLSDETLSSDEIDKKKMLEIKQQKVGENDFKHKKEYAEEYKQLKKLQDKEKKLQERSKNIGSNKINAKATGINKLINENDNFLEPVTSRLDKIIQLFGGGKSNNIQDQINAGNNSGGGPIPLAQPQPDQNNDVDDNIDDDYDEVIDRIQNWQNYIDGQGSDVDMSKINDIMDRVNEYEEAEREKEEERAEKEAEEREEKESKQNEEESEREETHWKDLFDSIKNIWQAPMNFIANSIETLDQKMYKVFFGNEGDPDDKGLVGRLSDNIGDLFMKVIDSLKEEFLNPVKKFIREDVMGGTLKDTINSTINNFKKIFETPVEEDEDEDDEEKESDTEKKTENVVGAGNFTGNGNGFIGGASNNQANNIDKNQQQVVDAAKNAANTANKIVKEITDTDEENAENNKQTAENTKILADAKKAEIKEAKKNKNKSSNPNSIKGNLMSLVDDMKEAFSEYIFGKNKDANGKQKPFMTQVTDKMAISFKNFNDFFFGKSNYDYKEADEDYKKAFKASMPKGIARGIVTGGGLALTSMAGSMGGFGLLGSLFLPGGIIGSMVLGMGIGFASQNRKLMDWLFGSKMADGTRADNGKIPRKVTDFFQKNKKTILGAGIMGTISGITGIGPISGLLSLLGGGGALGAIPALGVGIIGPVTLSVGAALALRSEKVQKWIFGEFNEAEGKKIGGLAQSKAMQYMKQKLPNVITGAAAGAGISLIGSQFGILGSLMIGPTGAAILGGAVGLGLASSKFKEALFGKQNKDGSYQSGGLADKIQNFFLGNFVYPVGDFFKKQLTETKKWFKKNILGQLLAAMTPYKLFIKSIGNSIKGAIKGLFDEISGSVKSVFSPILSPVRKILFGVLNVFKKSMGLIGDMTGKAARSMISLPVDILTAPAKILGTYYRHKGTDEQKAAMAKSDLRKAQRDQEIENQYKAEKEANEAEAKKHKEREKLWKRNGYDLTSSQLSAKSKKGIAQKTALLAQHTRQDIAENTQKTYESIDKLAEKLEDRGRLTVDEVDKFKEKKKAKADNDYEAKNNRLDQLVEGLEQIVDLKISADSNENRKESDEFSTKAQETAESIKGLIYEFPKMAEQVKATLSDVIPNYDEWIKNKPKANDVEKKADVQTDQKSNVFSNNPNANKENYHANKVENANDIENISDKSLQEIANNAQNTRTDIADNTKQTNEKLDKIVNLLQNNNGNAEGKSPVSGPGGPGDNFAKAEVNSKILNNTSSAGKNIAANVAEKIKGSFNKANTKLQTPPTTDANTQNNKSNIESNNKPMNGNGDFTGNGLGSLIGKAAGSIGRSLGFKVASGTAGAAISTGIGAGLAGGLGKIGKIASSVGGGLMSGMLGAMSDSSSSSIPRRKSPSLNGAKTASALGVEDTSNSDPRKWYSIIKGRADDLFKKQLLEKFDNISDSIWDTAKAAANGAANRFKSLFSILKSLLSALGPLAAIVSLLGQLGKSIMGGANHGARDTLNTMHGAETFLKKPLEDAFKDGTESLAKEAMEYYGKRNLTKKELEDFARMKLKKKMPHPIDWAKGKFKNLKNRFFGTSAGSNLPVPVPKQNLQVFNEQSSVWENVENELKPNNMPEPKGKYPGLPTTEVADSSKSEIKSKLARDAAEDDGLYKNFIKVGETAINQLKEFGPLKKLLGEKALAKFVESVARALKTCTIDVVKKAAVKIVAVLTKAGIMTTAEVGGGAMAGTGIGALVAGSGFAIDTVFATINGFFAYHNASELIGVNPEDLNVKMKLACSAYEAIMSYGPLPIIELILDLAYQFSGGAIDAQRQIIEMIYNSLPGTSSMDLKKLQNKSKAEYEEWNAQNGGDKTYEDFIEDKEKNKDGFIVSHAKHFGWGKALFGENDENGNYKPGVFSKAQTEIKNTWAWFIGQEHVEPKQLDLGDPNVKRELLEAIGDPMAMEYSDDVITEWDPSSGETPEGLYYTPKQLEMLKRAEEAKQEQYNKDAEDAEAGVRGRIGNEIGNTMAWLFGDYGAKPKQLDLGDPDVKRDLIIAAIGYKDYEALGITDDQLYEWDPTSGQLPNGTYLTAYQQDKINNAIKTKQDALNKDAEDAEDGVFGKISNSIGNTMAWIFGDSGAKPKELDLSDIDTKQVILLRALGFKEYLAAGYTDEDLYNWDPTSGTLPNGSYLTTEQQLAMNSAINAQQDQLNKEAKDAENGVVGRAKEGIQNNLAWLFGEDKPVPEFDLGDPKNKIALLIKAGYDPNMWTLDQITEWDPTGGQLPDGNAIDENTRKTIDGYISKQQKDLEDQTDTDNKTIIGRVSQYIFGDDDHPSELMQQVYDSAQETIAWFMGVQKEDAKDLIDSITNGIKSIPDAILKKIKSIFGFSEEDENNENQDNTLQQATLDAQNAEVTGINLIIQKISDAWNNFDGIRWIYTTIFGFSDEEYDAMKADVEQKTAEAKKLQEEFWQNVSNWMDTNIWGPLKETSIGKWVSNQLAYLFGQNDDQGNYQKGLFARIKDTFDEFIGSIKTYLSDYATYVKKSFDYSWANTIGAGWKALTGKIPAWAQSRINEGKPEPPEFIHSNASQSDNSSSYDNADDNNSAVSDYYHQQREIGSSAGVGGQTSGNTDAFVGNGDFSQNDSRWSNNSYGAANMSDTGCGPTVMASVLSNEGVHTNPSQMASLANATGYNTGHGTSEGFMQTAAASAGISSQHLSNINDVVSNVNAGNQVVVGGVGDGSTFTKAGHYSRVAGISGNNAIMKDPRGFTSEVSLGKLASETKTAYAFSGNGQFTGAGDDDSIIAKPDFSSISDDEGLIPGVYRVLKQWVLDGGPFGNIFKKIGDIWDSAVKTVRSWFFGKSYSDITIDNDSGEVIDDNSDVWTQGTAGSTSGWLPDFSSISDDEGLIPGVYRVLKQWVLDGGPFGNIFKKIGDIWDSAVKTVRSWFFGKSYSDITIDNSDVWTQGTAGSTSGWLPDFSAHMDEGIFKGSLHSVYDWIVEARPIKAFGSAMISNIKSTADWAFGAGTGDAIENYIKSNGVEMSNIVTSTISNIATTNAESGWWPDFSAHTDEGIIMGSAHSIYDWIIEARPLKKLKKDIEDGFDSAIRYLFGDNPTKIAEKLDVVSDAIDSSLVWLFGEKQEDGTSQGGVFSDAYNWIHENVNNYIIIPLQTTFENINEGYNELTTDFSNWISGAEKEINDNGVVVGGFNILKDLVSGLWGAVWDNSTIQNAVNTAQSYIQQGFQAIADFGNGLIQPFKDAWKIVKDFKPAKFVANILGKAVKKGMGSDVFDKVKGPIAKFFGVDESDVDSGSGYGKQLKKPTYNMGNDYLSSYAGMIGSGSGIDNELSKSSNYYQTDAKWGASPLVSGDNNSGSMKDNGCGPTTLANVMSSLNGSTVTPKDAADMISSSDLPNNDSKGVTASYFPKNVEKLGGQFTAINPNDEKSVRAAIATGYPLIAGGVSDSNSPKNAFTTAGHYIMIRGGKNIDGKTYVNDFDPISANRNKSIMLNKVLDDVKKGGPRMIGLVTPNGYEIPNGVNGTILTNNGFTGSGTSGLSGDNAITKWALSHEGEQWMGGRTPDAHIQCDSFTAEAYKQAGIDSIGGTSTNDVISDVPFKTADAYHPLGDGYTPQSGDLVNSTGHVGIYLGNNKVISRDSTGGVKVWDLQAWFQQFPGDNGFGDIRKASGKDIPSDPSSTSSSSSGGSKEVDQFELLKKNLTTIAGDYAKSIILGKPYTGSELDDGLSHETTGSSNSGGSANGSAQQMNGGSNAKLKEFADYATTIDHIPADWQYAQMKGESDNGGSPLAVDDHNYAGITTNGDDNVPGTIYKKFPDDEAFKEYYPKYLNLYDENGVHDAKTLDEFIERIHDGGYFTAPLNTYKEMCHGALESEGLTPTTLGGSGFGGSGKGFVGAGSDNWVEQTGDVSTDGAQPQTMEALEDLGAWFKGKTGNRLVVTAVTNGEHNPGEFSHSAGWKIDANDWAGPEGLPGGHLITADDQPGDLAEEFEKYGHSKGLGMNFEGTHYDISAHGTQWADSLDGTPKGELGGYNNPNGNAGKSTNSNSSSTAKAKPEDPLERFKRHIGIIAGDYAKAIISGKEYIGSDLSDPSSASSGSSSGSAQVTGENAKDIWNYLTKNMGLDGESAAAIMGNFAQESGYDPTIIEGGGHFTDTSTLVNDGGQRGFGIAQWTYPSRQQALADFANAKGKPASDLGVQLEFFSQEAQNGIPGLKSTSGIDAKTKYWQNSYEGASVPNMSNRISEAHNAYNQFNGSGNGIFGFIGNGDGDASIADLAKQNNIKFDNSSLNVNMDGYTIPDELKITDYSNMDEVYRKQGQQVQDYLKHKKESETPSSEHTFTPTKFIAGRQAGYAAEMSKGNGIQKSINQDNEGYNVDYLGMRTNAYSQRHAGHYRVSPSGHVIRRGILSKLFPRVSDHFYQMKDRQEYNKQINKAIKDGTIITSGKNMINTKDEEWVSKLSDKNHLEYDDFGNLKNFDYDESLKIKPEDDTDTKYKKQAEQVKAWFKANPNAAPIISNGISKRSKIDYTNGDWVASVSAANNIEYGNDGNIKGFDFDKSLQITDNDDDDTKYEKQAKQVKAWLKAHPKAKIPADIQIKAQNRDPFGHVIQTGQFNGGALTKKYNLKYDNMLNLDMNGYTVPQNLLITKWDDDMKNVYRLERLQIKDYLYKRGIRDNEFIGSGDGSDIAKLAQQYGIEFDTMLNIKNSDYKCPNELRITNWNDMNDVYHKQGLQVQDYIQKKKSGSTSGSANGLNIAKIAKDNGITFDNMLNISNSDYKVPDDYRITNWNDMNEVYHKQGLQVQDYLKQKGKTLEEYMNTASEFTPTKFIAGRQAGYAAEMSKGNGIQKAQGKDADGYNVDYLGLRTNAYSDRHPGHYKISPSGHVIRRGLLSKLFPRLSDKWYQMKDRQEYNKQFNKGIEDGTLITSGKNIINTNDKQWVAKLSKANNLQYDDFGNLQGIDYDESLKITADDDINTKYKKQAEQAKLWFKANPNAKPIKTNNGIAEKIDTSTGDWVSKLSKEKGLEYDDFGNLKGVEYDDSLKITENDDDNTKYKKQAEQVKVWMQKNGIVAKGEESKTADTQSNKNQLTAKNTTSSNISAGNNNISNALTANTNSSNALTANTVNYEKNISDIANNNTNSANTNTITAGTNTGNSNSINNNSGDTNSANNLPSDRNSNKPTGTAYRYAEQSTDSKHNDVIAAINSLDIHAELASMIGYLKTIADNQGNISNGNNSSNSNNNINNKVNAASIQNNTVLDAAREAIKRNPADNKWPINGGKGSDEIRGGTNNYQSIHEKNMQIASASGLTATA